MVALRSLGRIGGRHRLLLLAAVLGGLLALAQVAPAFAQETTATESPIGGSVSGYDFGDWMNLVLRLALVLVIIWLAIVGMRWWVRRMNGSAARGGGHLQVIESRSLGPNRSLQLVKLGNRAVLLGVTAEQISSVLEVNDPTEVERLAAPAVTDDSPTSFGDAVSRLGALTRWRPVIERRSPQSPAGEPAPSRAPRRAAPAMGQRSTTAAAMPTQPERSRWMTLARRVIGLEDPPRPRLAAMGAGPMTAPQRARRSASAGRAPRSITAARNAAAELPVSRAARATSGYRQNQIAEAQRAIASVRADLGR